MNGGSAKSMNRTKTSLVGSVNPKMKVKINRSGV